jgi:uncharacterized protein (TIGR00255 family)
MLSMTGYGRAEDVLEGKKLIVEIKSLNHRYLEMIIRLHPLLASLEVEIKKKVSERLFRGRIEINVQMDTDIGEGRGGQYGINLPLIRNYYDLLNRIRAEFGFRDEITLDMMTRFKDVFVPSESQFDLKAACDTLKKILVEAIDALLLMRMREGEALREDFLFRLKRIRECLDLSKARIPEIVQGYQRRLTDRVRELADGIDVEPWRLAQEVAILAEKSDITEEIVRLESHFQQFEKLLLCKEPVGRKIDFLLQEMNREVNTMGSKCSDVILSHEVIELKNEIAKLREQVQNVE